MTTKPVTRKRNTLPPGPVAFLITCGHAANMARRPGGFGDQRVGFSGHRVSDELGHRLYAEISSFVSDPAGFRRRRRAAIDVMIEDVKVETTLELQPDGRIEHKHNYRTPNDEAIVGLCLAFLCDPRFPNDEVRLCKLETCERVFFRRGSKRQYCSQGCSDAGDRLQAARVRVPAMRARDAKASTAQSRKHK